MGAREVLLWSAAATSALTFAVHLCVGGVRVARPLLADRGLPRASKWLNYYCWHVTTVVIAFKTAALALLAVAPREETAAAAFLAALSAALSLLSASVALKARIAPWRFPSTSLFAATTVLVASALLAG